MDEKEIKLNEKEAFKYFNKFYINNFKFEVLTNKFLCKKYSNSENYYFSKDINSIIEKNNSIAFINYYDIKCFHKKKENLKKFYFSENYSYKLKKYLEYYKFHFEIPRIFMKEMVEITHNYFDKIRKINFVKITNKLNKKNGIDKILSINYSSDKEDLKNSTIKGSLICLLKNKIKNLDIKKKKENDSKNLTIKDLEKLFNDEKEHKNKNSKDNKNNKISKNSSKNNFNLKINNKINSKSKKKIFKKKYKISNINININIKNQKIIFNNNSKKSFKINSDKKDKQFKQKLINFKNKKFSNPTRSNKININKILKTVRINSIRFDENKLSNWSKQIKLSNLKLNKNTFFQKKFSENKINLKNNFFKELGKTNDYNNFHCRIKSDVKRKIKNN